MLCNFSPFKYEVYASDWGTVVRHWIKVGEESKPKRPINSTSNVPEISCNARWLSDSRATLARWHLGNVSNTNLSSVRSLNFVPPASPPIPAADIEPQKWSAQYGSWLRFVFPSSFILMSSSLNNHEQQVHNQSDECNVLVFLASREDPVGFAPVCLQERASTRSSCSTWHLPIRRHRISSAHHEDCRHSDGISADLARTKRLSQEKDRKQPFNDKQIVDRRSLSACQA